MNTRSIQKLRHKFMLVSMLTYALVMFFMGACINLSNYYMSNRQIRSVTSYILEHEGILPYTGQKEQAQDILSGAGSAENPDHDGADLKKTDAGPTISVTPAVSDEDIRHITGAGGDSVLDDFSPEFHYSARYFTATFGQDGSLETIRTTHVTELTKDQAMLVAKAAYQFRNSFGRLGNYYFRKGEISDGSTMIVCLNCTSQIRSNRRILNITLLISIAGLLITFILVFIFSNRVIQPEIENVRRQKQFITNASHELKTPLAVIRANTEIEEMMNGQSEWTESTMRQIDRLDGLVQNLVMISRAAEQEDRSVMTEINVSQNIEESVNPYRSLAQQEKKELLLRITPDVRMLADESKIRQLAALLVDNAFKYCDEGGTIRITLDPLRKGKALRLVVANTFSEGANIDYSRFFERFYREDESHSVDRGGYGIGLSIAESICQQYGGSISAAWKNGEIAFTCYLTC